eukprot:GHVU01165365.1.p1 GENE.GHVU01165365.1~~GHVU01165365.1.p1  ORF type:complete len:212 (+),score=26.40 GHVU01165365.1:242-877(+)
MKMTSLPLCFLLILFLARVDGKNNNDKRPVEDKTERIHEPSMPEGFHRGDMEPYQVPPELPPQCFLDAVFRKGGDPSKLKCGSALDMYCKMKPYNYLHLWGKSGAAPLHEEPNWLELADKAAQCKCDCKYTKCVKLWAVHLHNNGTLPDTCYNEFKEECKAGVLVKRRRCKTLASMISANLLHFGTKAKPPYGVNFEDCAVDTCFVDSDGK